MDSVIIYSSGIDSYLLRKYLTITHPTEKFKCVYYDIKCRYSKEEIDMLKIQQEKEKFDLVIDDTFNFGNIERDDAFIPNRNLHLTMHATKYGDKIYIGGTASDRISDNNEKIFQDFSKIISESLDKRIIITSPFWNIYKSQIAEWYATGYIKKTELSGSTFSCYSPKIKKSWCALEIDKEVINSETNECLFCKACFRKNVVLNAIGVFRQFYNKEIIESYFKECSNSIVQNYRQIKTLDYICHLDKKK